MPHEHWNRLIEHLIFVLAEELNLKFGFHYLQRLNQARGAEPDSSFYIQNAARIRVNAKLTSRKIRHRPSG